MFHKKISLGNEIKATDIPLEGLDAGNYVCNDKGIFKDGETICYHPIIPVAKYTNINNNKEKIKLAFRKNNKWNYFIADKQQISVASKIIFLSDRKENNYKLNSDGTIKSFSTNQFEEIRDKGLQHLREINTGKKQSKETKEKLSNSHLGMTYDDLTKQKLSEIRKGKHVKSKIHVEKNGTIYSSISECMDKLNIPRSQITEENGFIIIRE